MNINMINDNIAQEDLLRIINELSQKKRDSGLTADEQIIQKKVYAIYLSRIRKQFDTQLDNVKVQNSDGTLTPFKTYAKDNKVNIKLK